MSMTWLNENVEVPTGITIADGLDEGAIGYTTTPTGNEHVIYDVEKCIAIFMKQNDWTHEDAQEWMEFNVICAYVGENTPLWMFK